MAAVVYGAVAVVIQVISAFLGSLAWEHVRKARAEHIGAVAYLARAGSAGTNAVQCRHAEHGLAQLAGTGLVDHAVAVLVHVVAADFGRAWINIRIRVIAVQKTGEPVMILVQVDVAVRIKSVHCAIAVIVLVVEALVARFHAGIGLVHDSVAVVVRAVIADLGDGHALVRAVVRSVRRGYAVGLGIRVLVVHRSRDIATRQGKQRADRTHECHQPHCLGLVVHAFLLSCIQDSVGSKSVSFSCFHDLSPSIKKV